MKPFYILLLIIGCALILFGTAGIIDGATDVHRTLTHGEDAPMNQPEGIFFSSITFIIGLLISLFSRGKLKQLKQ